MAVRLLHRGSFEPRSIQHGWTETRDKKHTEYSYSTLGKDFEGFKVYLMHPDPSDLGLICLVKKREIRFWIWESNLGFAQRNVPLIAKLNLNDSLTFTTGAKSAP